MSTATLQDPAIISDDEHYEVIDGNRVRTPPMGVLAVWIASDLHAYLAHFVKTHGIGRAIAEALFRLPAPVDRDRRPDVAFVSYQRWPKNRPIPPTDNAWDVVPNLATEVVSPNDSIDELEQKISEYFRAGVELVWVVHPTRSKIHVYSSPTQPILVLTRNDTLEGGTVMPGFRLPLMELFTEAAEAPEGTNSFRVER